jgi:hypothetical protein
MKMINIENYDFIMFRFDHLYYLNTENPKNPFSGRNKDESKKILSKSHNYY